MSKQKFLPGFPEGATQINDTLRILKKDGHVTYFSGLDNIFSHLEDEAPAYRFALAMLMASGYVRACELTKPPSNIPYRTLMNWVTQWRNKGPTSFFRASPRHVTRIITKQIASECGVLLAGGKSIAAVAKELGIKDSTLRKAIQRGDIVIPSNVAGGNMAKDDVSTKSDCSREDAEAAIVKDVWPQNQLVENQVTLPGGETTSMKLARRETVLTSGRNLGTPEIAGGMFARWCQENYFAYMMKHFDIDGLVQYGTESLPGSVMVINPAWRILEKAIKKARQAVRKLQAKLGAADSMDDGPAIQKKAEYLHDIQIAEIELESLREERKKTQKKVMVDSLPDNQRPTQLLPLNKMLTDIVKMIAYRAETAMVGLLRCHLEKEDEARALIRELFVTAADIEPNVSDETLYIRIHRMACPSHDKAITLLLEELNKLEFHHPETGEKMIYSLV